MAITLSELIHKLLSAPDRTPNLLAGAGLSVDADIPLASVDLEGNESVATRAARHHFFLSYQRSPETAELMAYKQACNLTNPSDCYATALELVAPGDNAGKRRFLEQFFKGRRPTRAHQIIAEFVTHGYFQSIFTTNFDPLIERALMFAGVDCAVATHSAMLKDLPKPGECPIVYKVHGDYLADNQKHLPEQVAELESDMHQRLVSSFADRDLLVIGYAGWDPSVMNAIRQGLANTPDAKVFWLLFGSACEPDVAHDFPGRFFFHRITSNQSFFEDLHRHLLARRLLIRDDPRIRQVFYLGRTNITLLEGDITEVPTEAIVSSDDTELTMGGGVSGAIRWRAGNSVYTDAQSVQRPIQLGTVAATGPGQLADLGVRYIFHAAVIPSFGDKATADIVAAATLAALQAAEERGLQSLALPALGTGSGQAGAASCAEAMVRTVLNHVHTPGVHLRQVVFVVRGDVQGSFTDRLTRDLGGEAQLLRLGRALAASDNPRLQQAGATLLGGGQFLRAEWPAAAAFLRNLAGADWEHPAVWETTRYCWAVWQTELCRLLAEKEPSHSLIAALRRQIGALETANPAVF